MDPAVTLAYLEQLLDQNEIMADSENGYKGSVVERIESLLRERKEDQEHRRSTLQKLIDAEKQKQNFKNEADRLHRQISAIRQALK